MSKKYNISDCHSQTVSDSAIACEVKSAPLHLDITLEDNAVVADIKKAIKMIRGIAAVRMLNTAPANVITPALAKKLEKAHRDYAEGKYTECRTQEELESFLNAL